MKGNKKQTDGTYDATVGAADGEHQTYLRVAEIVLASALQPLKAREIVERGIEQGLFGDHVVSRTPEKSMQARLSMDILNRAGQSRFARTGRGRFTLRARLAESSASLPGSDSSLPPTSEYVAERRVLRTPKEEVLCVSEPSFRDVLTFQGIDTDARSVLDRLLRNQNVHYVPRTEAEVRNDAKQFITYVLVQCGQRLLFFKRSYLSRAAEFLRGSKCVGFGGHVSAADADMLSLKDFGLAACARRELFEELELPHGKGSTAVPGGADEPSPLSERAPNRPTVRLFQTASLEQLGVLNDDSSEVGRRHVAVVYRVWLPDWNVARQLRKGESSIKGLGWIDLSRDAIDISDFEYWSQLCLRKFYPSTVVTKAGVKFLGNRKLASDRIIVVAGRIGSGKSETAGYLSQKLGVPLVKSGALLQELMGVPPMAEIGRKEFQARALSFISTEDGPSRLSEAIALRLADSGASKCVVDGVRHLATLEGLAARFDDHVSLVFVQTPPDVAYEMYRAREAQGNLTFSYREFLEIYDAPVESEISSLGRKAQVYIYNSFGMEAFRRTLDDVAAAFLNVRAEEGEVTSRGRGRARYSDDAA